MENFEVSVPQINVNDSSATIVKWQAEEGSQVRAGDPVVSIETSKAVVDIEAPADGFLLKAAEPGDTVEIGAIVARIAPTREAYEAAVRERSESEREVSKQVEVRATERARRFAHQQGVDLSNLKGLGIITERHIREHLERTGEPQQKKSVGRPSVARKTPLGRVGRAVSEVVTRAASEQATASLQCDV